MMANNIKLITIVVTFVICSAQSRLINEAGLQLIEEFEGFEPNFSPDPVGIKTIGYGHACHVNDCSQIHAPLTKEQAVELLKKDLVEHEDCVEKYVPGLDLDKFSALVSFSFNLGCGTLEKSAIPKDCKESNYKAAAEEFGKYVHAGGKVLAGLVRRRAAEKALFCKSGGC